MSAEHSKHEKLLEYHNRTKHSLQRYARSLGYMDWANQPDPFRFYERENKMPLVLKEDRSDIPYSTLFTKTHPTHEFNLAAIGSFFGIESRPICLETVWSK